METPESNDDMTTGSSSTVPAPPLSPQSKNWALITHLSHL